MAIVDRKWSALPVPYAVEYPDRAPKERYFDEDFFRMEVKLLWSRVWQMACRLEEIPEPNDFAEYEILDQSIVVVRTEDHGVRAFQNACRHRGVKVAEGRGSCETGFICPFHGWCYGPDGTNTFVTRRKDVFRTQPADAGDQPDAGPLRDVGWVCLDQPRRCGTPAARVHRTLCHGAGRMDGGVVADRVVARVPSSRELEACRRGVHGAVPRGRDPPRARDPRSVPVAPRRGDRSRAPSWTPSSTICRS